MRKGSARRAGGLRLVQPRPKAGRRRSLKAVLLLLLLLGLGLLLFKAVERCCRVEEITVTGNERLSEQEIISESGIKKGTSLLLLPCGKVEKKLAGLPGLSSAVVKRRFPSAVRISVQERREAASLMDQNHFWLVDGEGIVFDEQPHPAGNLPVVTGALSGEISLGKPLDHERKSAALCIFLEALQGVPLLSPAELNLSDPAALVLYTSDGRRVLLGDSGRMTEKLTLLQAFLQESNGGRFLDLRTGDRLVVVSGEGCE